MTPEMTEELENLRAFKPIWTANCEVCGASPVVSAVGLCGPCTWGEADTIGGAWWDAENEKRLAELEAQEGKE